MINSSPEKIKKQNKYQKWNNINIKDLYSDKRIRFVLTASVLYILAYIIYDLILKRYTLFDEYFIRIIIENTEEILKRLGYNIFKTTDINDFQVIGIHGSVGVWVGKACDAISLFLIFAIFIIAFPARSRNKWWFIPFGILTIHLINVLRVTALVIITYYAPQWLEFNHTYTFTFIVYSYIFTLWVWWVNKLA